MTNKNHIGWNFDPSYNRLPEIFFSKQNPTPVSSPELIIFNESLAQSLGLKIQELKSVEGVSVFAGNKIPEGAEALAQSYAGHQFGNFTMLGDGRAILLGEQITQENERFDIQLKGSGPTVYSRGGDGRAALGPMLREYIISETMHALGIPTTRSLAVVTTGEPVYREIELPGAILTRVSQSHLRVGTFQFARNWGKVEDLQSLADYTLQRHFPNYKDADHPYLYFLEQVIKRQAELISKWQLVGFIHGVMNTDNMTISGETIDYGPCAFMDSYDPATVFSSIDRQGRYAYGNQPYYGQWNLARFAESLLPLLAENEEQAIKLAEDALSRFGDVYFNNWFAGMRAKLGILNEEKEDKKLINNLLELMQTHSADYTNTFRALTMDRYEGIMLFETNEFKDWHTLWQERLKRQQESKENSKKLMRNTNPSVIPRNHRVEEALDAAVESGDYSVMEKLLKVLSEPFAYTSEQDEYCTLPASSAEPYVTFCGT